MAHHIPYSDLPSWSFLLYKANKGQSLLISETDRKRGTTYCIHDTLSGIGRTLEFGNDDHICHKSAIQRNQHDAGCSLVMTF
jgi:hypothetical protein